MKKLRKALFILSLAGLLSSCAFDFAKMQENQSQNQEGNEGDPINPDPVDPDPVDPDPVNPDPVEPDPVDPDPVDPDPVEPDPDPEPDPGPIEEDPNTEFSIETSDGSFTRSGSVYTLTSAGTYNLSGYLEGQIYVDAGDDDKIEIALNGLELHYDLNSPIYIANADGVDISAKNGTENKIVDERSSKVTEEDSQGEGAIYSKCDLKLKGKGSLDVTGNYNNGVHSTDDLEFKNLTVVSRAVNHAFKGNDSITVESGTLTAISASGDGFKTANSDISSKGNQRGSITVLGGTINSYSAYDAMDAAYDVVVSGGNLNLFTNKYATEYIDITENVSTTKMYLRIPSNYYSTSYRFSLYFYDGDGNSLWSDTTYETSKRESGRTYYYYSLDRNTTYNSFKVYRFANGAENSTTAYDAVSRGATVNESFDTLKISSISGSTITAGGWTNFINSQGGPGGPGGGPGQEGNSDKSTDSAKGLKAANTINISCGTIKVKAYDDAIHANYGDTLENGETGLGDVTISGGTLELYASDDGIHADRNLNIDGGDIEIQNAYEGLEGNIININNGTTKLYATDDGVNVANKAGLTPQVNVNGGLVDITITTGDVDGIDSNGNYKQTGGTVITRSAKNSTNNMATGLDCDGTATMTGGTFICIGPMEKTLSKGSGVYNANFGAGSSSGWGGSSGTAFSAGTYTIEVLDLSFELVATYYGIRTYSSLYTSGQNVVLSYGSSTMTSTAS